MVIFILQNCVFVIDECVWNPDMVWQQWALPPIVTECLTDLFSDVDYSPVAVTVSTYKNAPRAPPTPLSPLTTAAISV